MADNSIVTVKLTNAVISKAVGPDVKVKIQVGTGPTVERIKAGGQERWLLQGVFTNSPLNVSLDVKEIDPKFTDAASTNANLAVDLSAPKKRTKSGTRTVTLKVDAVGGDKGKTANFAFDLKWYVSSNVADPIDYIRGEMVGNLSSTTFKQIEADYKASKGSKDPQKRLKPLFDFARMVGYGKPWDHKAFISTNWGDWALDASKGRQYRFDLWSNIHYGYIGKAIGFSDDLLLDAAGLAQAINEEKWPQVIKAILSQSGRELDEPEDQVAIQLGIRLWKKHGNAVTSEIILKAIRGVASDLPSKPADEGTPPESFLKK